MLSVSVHGLRLRARRVSLDSPSTDLSSLARKILQEDHQPIGKLNHPLNRPRDELGDSIAEEIEEESRSLNFK